MKGGAKLTHKYLPAMGTQYLHVIDGEYVDSKGYILNKTDVESRLKANILSLDGRKLNQNNTNMNEADKYAFEQIKQQYGMPFLQIGMNAIVNKTQ